MKGWRGVLAVVGLLLVAGILFFVTSNRVAQKELLAQQAAEGDNSNHPGWVSLQGEPLSQKEIVQRVAPSVVVVHANNSDQTGSLGTGFIVDASGRVVTNYHVVDNAQEIFIKLQSGEVQRAERIAAVSANWDLALIEVPQLKGAFQPLLLADGIPPLSSDVWVVGTPNAFPHSVAYGKLLGARGRDLEGIEISAPIREGYSGSPILNHSGEVIGVVAQGTLGRMGITGYGSSVWVLKTFLKEKPQDRRRSDKIELPQDQWVPLLPDGGYKARILKDAILYDRHSLSGEQLGRVEKKAPLHVLREWIEPDPRVARLTEKLIILTDEKTERVLEKGSALRIKNPAVTGEGIICTVQQDGDEFEIALDDAQIERLEGQSWCQVVMDSGESGWIPKADLKEKKGILSSLLALFQ